MVGTVVVTAMAAVANHPTMGRSGHCRLRARAKSYATVSLCAAARGGSGGKAVRAASGSVHAHSGWKQTLSQKELASSAAVQPGAQ